MPKANHIQLEQNILDKGLKIIIYAFNEQKKGYSKNILQLETEIRKLKEENYIYKNKLTILQKKLNILSRTVCDVDLASGEIKNQIEKKLNESKKVMATVNNEYSHINRNRKKNNSVNNKLYLYKNFMLQNKNNFPYQLQEDSKHSSQKEYSNNFQYNLKNKIDSHKHSYNKLIENINYITKNKNYFQKDYSYIHNSFLVENTPKDVDINMFEESRTDRDFNKRTIYSEKNLKMNRRRHGKSYTNKIKNFLNINNTSSYSANDLNEFNNSDVKKNGNETYNKYDNNLCPKNTNEDEIYFKYMKISGDNNSKLYKKLNIFLEECKKKLNALDYENVINLLKSFEIDSNIDIKKKIKKYLNNNHKLCKLFDNIFEP